MTTKTLKERAQDAEKIVELSQQVYKLEAEKLKVLSEITQLKTECHHSFDFWAEHPVNGTEIYRCRWCESLRNQFEISEKDMFTYQFPHEADSEKTPKNVQNLYLDLETEDSE